MAINYDDKDLNSKWLKKPEIGKTVTFQVIGDAEKILKEAKKDGRQFATYQLRVLEEGTLEPKDLSLFVTDYKKMLEDAKKPATLVKLWFKMSHTFNSNDKYPEGRDVFPIEFLKDYKGVAQQ